MTRTIIQHHFEELRSTNEWLIGHLNDVGKDEIIVVIAEKQSAGKGRFGKAWHSPPEGNFYGTFGFLYRNELLPLVAGIAVANTLTHFGFKPRLKWPNDVLVDGKKIAGILCEIRNGVAIAGIGLNVNMKDVSQIDQPTTSMSLVANRDFAINDVSENLIRYFADELGLDQAEILKRYADLLLHHPGSPIRFNGPDGPIEGTFVGIDKDGRLRMQTHQGIRVFSSGFILN